MKKSEIKVGGFYLAKVSGREVPVRVDVIGPKSAGYPRGKYEVTNLATGRKTTFASAAKFRSEVSLRDLPALSGLTSKQLWDKYHIDTTCSGRVRAEPLEGEKRPDPTPVPAAAPRGSRRRSSRAGASSATAPKGETHPPGNGSGTTNSKRGTQSRGAKTSDTTGKEGEQCPDPTTVGSKPLGATIVSEVGRSPTNHSKDSDTSAQPNSPITARLLQRAEKQREAERKFEAAFPDLAERARGSINSSGLPPHLLVTARAGTGKTWVISQGLYNLKGYPTEYEPSPQQREVWAQLYLSRKERFICSVAFNTDIAEELKRKVPPGVDAMTMHSMAFRELKRVFKLKSGENVVDEFRTRRLICEVMEEPDYNKLLRTQPALVFATEKLVALCKQNLIPLDVVGDDTGMGQDSDRDACYRLLDELAERHDIPLSPDGYVFSPNSGTRRAANPTAAEGMRERVFDLVPRVLERAVDVTKDGAVDFDDMIWLVIRHGLKPLKYGLLLGDEAQDWNRMQQELAFMCGSRLVIVGDDRQAIYGFAGADSDSLPNLRLRLSHTPAGVVDLPLTVTRRCGKVIAEEARRIVPDFEAHSSNPEGKISTAPYLASGTPLSINPHVDGSYRDLVRPGDFILCRVNAPLVGECYRFIRRGRAAHVLGRKIGESLISLIGQLSGGDLSMEIHVLLERLGRWLQREVAKERLKTNVSEQRIINLHDKASCITCLSMSLPPGTGFLDNTVRQLVGVIVRIFPEEDSRGRAKVSSNSIRLSSIHRAKGLEADRVFLIQTEASQCPHPMAKSDWQVAQEWNLLYVAITRAKRELIYVR